MSRPSDAASQPEMASPLTFDEALANLRSKDPSLRYYAAWWIGRERADVPEAIDALIECLGFTGDRTEEGAYPLQRNAARALGKLGDRRAVQPLIACLASSDFYVREAAAQSLGMLGDRAAVDPLLGLLGDGVDVAQRVPGKPHLVQPCAAILEALGDLGATEALETILRFVDRDLPKLQYAATRAAYQLTGEERYAQTLVAALQGDSLQLRRTVLGDLGAIGYRPAAEAIASALAENSLKLIALKRIVEHPRGRSDSDPEALTDSDCSILALMDSLL